MVAVVPRLIEKGQFTMSIPATARGRRISLGQLHLGQSKAHLGPAASSFQGASLRTAVRQDGVREDMDHARAYAREECAWFAPQHMTWSEVHLDLAQMLQPILDSSSRTPPVIRLSNGGRIDFWSLENPIAGRGRRAL